MRFGKKLALQVTADQTGAPYLSHKIMKEAINKTVRELRLYQSAKQSLESWQSGRTDIATAEEIAQIEDRIMAFDAQLFQIVDQDLMHIFGHVRSSEARLGEAISDFQARAVDLGLLVEESRMDRLKQVLPSMSDSYTVLCQRLLELRLRSEPLDMAEQMEQLSEQYCELVEQVDEHMQYLEINVAGFRKLLKRHEKQIPQKFHACQPPCLEFHSLVTRTSRMLADVARMLGTILQNARDRLASITATAGMADSDVLKAAKVPLKEIKGLGPECEMVMQIQQQLRDTGHASALDVDVDQVGLLHLASPAVTTAPLGLVYMKP